MADFQRSIARDMGVSLRTVRRWCERGELPGAYPTKGGHWRIRRPSKAKLDALRAKARGSPAKRMESFEHRLAGAIYFATRTKAETEHWKRITAPMAELARKMQFKPLFPPKAQANFLRLAKWACSDAAGIVERAYRLSIEWRFARLRLTPEERAEADWRALDPEFFDMWYHTDVAAVDYSRVILPDALRAAKAEANATRLFTAAQRIANDGERISAAALARRMKMPRATFYRCFTRKQIDDAKALPFKGASLAERGSELNVKKNGSVIS